ncbi:MAG: Clp1/GlmU family protein [Sulfolobales archaeon]
MNINLIVDEGRILRICGPASIEVLNGEVMIAGASFTTGSKLVINKYRSYGIKAVRRSELKVALGSGGSLDEPQVGEEVIDSWLNICAEVVRDRRRVRVIIIGPPEAGKTSLTAFIANRLISEGREVYIVDADIGQADIAVPCTIGVAKPRDKFLWLRELQPVIMKYVGCNSPQFCAHQFIAAFQEVVYELLNRDVDLIVNTDGWVSGYSALELKELMIRMLRPTHVIVLDDMLYTYFKNSLKSYPSEVLVAPKPKVVRERDREDRRYLRHHSYMKLFSNVRRVRLSIDSLTLIGFCILSGKPLNTDELRDYLENYNALREGIAYCSLLHNVLNVVFKKGFKVSPSQVICKKDLELNIVYEGDEKGL